ncbi:hypothetical protein BGY98DRAFT_1103332 [Russula aff. rugulosa BPL654]|nr:hypothetical protein BGY98DRAFT_1103332 [Russula aff. rugulosa BPL654]
MAPKQAGRPKGNVHVAAQPKPRRVTIDILPEEVLLEVFDFYVDPTRSYGGEEAWCTLVHVCRKWRNIVLESPLRLNLRIRCHPETPVREKLDTWPTSLITIYKNYEPWEQKWVANVAAALEQNNRIRQINLWGVPTSEMEEILAALMHKSFPILTDLSLGSDDETAPVDPELFLGGSAPCLECLNLISIPFPGLPKLLISAAHLTNLQLCEISHSGYISPEAMASCFSVLTRLEILFLEFKSPESFPFRKDRPPPPLTRTLLPALAVFQFYGVSEYLEDLVVRIDTPQLDKLKISLFHQFIPDTSQLVLFINRLPKLKAHIEIHVHFYESGRSGVYVKLGRFLIKDWESYMKSATVEHLYICDEYDSSWRDIQGESNRWLELLRPFTSVKSLYLSHVIVRCIVPALRELVGEKVAEVLPAMKTLFLPDFDLLGPASVPEAIRSFVSGRQFFGRPVAVSHWRRKY